MRCSRLNTIAMWPSGGKNTAEADSDKHRHESGVPFAPISRFHARMFVQSGSARLYAEAMGDPHDPGVILVMGAQASSICWPQDFCDALVKRKRYVLRFDHRDTGLSTKYPIGAPPYSAEDLADDVIAVLDAFGVKRAQLV